MTYGSNEQNNPLMGFGCFIYELALYLFNNIRRLWGTWSELPDGFISHSLLFRVRGCNDLSVFPSRMYVEQVVVRRISSDFFFAVL